MSIDNNKILVKDVMLSTDKFPIVSPRDLIIETIEKMNKFGIGIACVINEKMILHQIAIINSMTKKEKADPEIIKASRKIRISKGSGTRVQDVNKLLKQFLQSQKMMKRMKSMGKTGMPNDLMQKLQGNFPPKLN